MKSNQTENSTPFFQILSDDQVFSIHSGVLEVLEYTGVKIMHQKAREIMQDAGCKVSGETVKIPAWMVQEALRKVPKSWSLYNRNGENPLRIQRNNTYWGTGVTCPYTLDIYNGERRPTTVNDIANHTKLADCLPNYDWVEPFGQAQDVPQEVADVYEFEAYINNTTKPVIFIAVDNEGVKDIFKMAAVVAGSEEKLVEKPFIIQYSEPITPLVHCEDAVSKLLTTCELGIPLLHSPCAIAGGTAPATLPGTLVIALSECLSGMVLSQLVRPGLPHIIGGVMTSLDMATGVMAYGAPELSILVAMLGDMARYYDLPTFGTAGCSDSKICDEQAAIESAFSIVMNSLAGMTFVHDSGFLENGLVASPEELVMNDEIIGMARHLMRGVKINNETLALDLIHKQGPHKAYVDTRHTFEHFKTEFWRPTLMDRQVYSKWCDSGKKTMRERVNEKTKNIIENHIPDPLSEEQKLEIQKIRKASEKKRVK